MSHTQGKIRELTISTFAGPDTEDTHFRQRVQVDIMTEFRCPHCDRELSKIVWETLTYEETVELVMLLLKAMNQVVNP